MDTPITNPVETPSIVRASAAFANADDFLAIGLRPMEFRPGVIRRAMSRSAEPLASLHLNQPDTALERKLAQIVMTGYRLLDPRRREDSLQRMMLGRIHPQLADEAARIAQSNGTSLTQLTAPDGLDAEPFEGIGLLAVNGQANRGSKQGGRFSLHDPLNAWSDSLRSHDLLVERPWRRASRMTRRWVATRTLAAVAVVACAVTTLTLWRSTQPSDDRSVVEGRGPEAVRSPALASMATAPSQTQTEQLSSASMSIASLEAMTPPSQDQNDAVADPTAIAPVRMDLELAAAFEKTQSLPGEEVGPQATLAAPTLGDMPSGDTTLGDAMLPEMAMAPNITPVSSAAATITPATITPAEIAMDQSLAQQVAPMVPPEADVAVEASPSLAVPLETAREWPVPDNDGLSDTIAQWNAIAQALAPYDWPGRYNRAIEFADAMPAVDTPESEARRHWIGYTQAASAAVLAGEHSDADRATHRLLDGFDVDEWAVTKAVLALTVSAELREREAKSISEWLSVWASRALVAGNLADAAFFNQQIDVVSRSTINQSLHSSTTEFRKTLTTAGRLAEVVERLETEYPEDGSGDLISPSDHYAAGRYWALIRRDWPRSIMHLSAGSDMRLANLATKESELSEMPTMGDLLELAKAYASMAEKSKGWIHDSFLLHADELLSRSDAIGSSSDSLELARYQKFLRSEHEAVFAFADRMKRPSRETEAP